MSHKLPIVLTITNRCNLKCKGCLREDSGQIDLPYSLIKKILPEVKKLGYFAVSITGGEPCFHPDFKEIIEIITKNKMRFSLVSNGYMLNNYKFIFDNPNLTHLAFSLDGSTKVIHDSIRGNGSFDKVLNSINYSVLHGLGGTIKTTINTRIMKRNFHDLEDIIKLASKLKVDKVWILTSLKTSFDKEELLNDSEKAELIKRARSLASHYKNMQISITHTLFNPGGINFCFNFDDYKVTISPKGEFVFCCNNIKGGAVIGSLYKESFADLYSKANDWIIYLKKVRAKMIAQGTDKSFPGFNTCEFCNTILAERIK